MVLRENTVIDQNIKLLKSESEVEERNKLPLFEPSDFDLEPKYKARQNNNPNVYNILDDYEDNFDEIREN